jgi:hypothetical protein
MDQQRPNPFDRIFDRLFTASSTEPYGLPIFKMFTAPVEAVKFDEFFAAYRANGWHLEEALTPYAADEQEGMCAFYDSAMEEYKFCPTLRFLRLNGIHVQLSNSAD